MTDTERIAKIEAKKKETIERLLGKEDKYPIPDAVETRLMSPITSPENSHYGKSMRKPANPCAFDPWLHEFNKQMHECNGKIVTYVESGLEDEVPPPVK